MTFRGYFALNGLEIANSSRVAAHAGVAPPTSDVGVLGGTVDCSMTPVSGHPLLGEVTADQAAVSGHPLLYTPPNGTRLYSPGLGLVGDCWDDSHLCIACQSFIEYDDSWDGLAAFLDHSLYRPELAPWYSTQVPESAEFGGVWLLDVKGLDVSTVQVTVNELAGDGGAVMPPRDTSRKITFDALLVACTTAGLDYGLQWLTAQLRTANTADGWGTLRYLATHPGNSAVDPTTLLREAKGVVMTAAPTIEAAINASHSEHQQATVYQVSWELTLTIPRIYLPETIVSVDWDTVTVDPIQWVHATDCGVVRAGCDTDPKLFAEGCEPVKIVTVNTPPPTCGGCLPVGTIATHTFAIPAADSPMRSRETALSLVVTNTGSSTLNLQGHFRRCATSVDCDLGDIWPFQISGLPATAALTLDATTGHPSVFYEGRVRRPIGIVGTPTGAPWLPVIMDRSVCWELIAVSSGDAEFTVDLVMADREA
jgi:hypothetical protein